MNGMSVRMGLALALLAAALLAGLYLSGTLTLFLLDLDIPLAWDTYPRYVRALAMPEMQPSADKVWLAGALGFGLPVFGWAVGAYFLLRYASHASSAPRAPARQTDASARSTKSGSYYDQHLHAVAARSPPAPGTEEGADMKHAQAVAAAASLALAACATPPNSKPQGSVPAMRSAETGNPAIPANPAEELGQKLLKLIGGLQSKRDLNVKRVNAAFGIQMTEDPQWPGQYEARVRLNERWYALIDYEVASDGDEARFEFNITRPLHDRYERLPLTDVCLEFDSLAAALEKLGYSREQTKHRGYYPTGDWRFYRRKPDHEYTELELAMENLDSLIGAGPVEISVSHPRQELINAAGEPAGGRRCITSIDINGHGS